MRTSGFVMIAAASCAVLAACSSPAADHGSTSDHGSPGAPISAEVGVLYYPACGNETLDWGGPTWYPFTPSNPEDFPEDPLAELPAAASAPDAAATGVVYAPMVVAPGPGDDVGTLVIYEGALAYWESDSGDLSTWLTTDEIEYLWMC